MRKKIIRYFVSICMTIRIYMISLFIVLLLLQNPAGVYVTQSEAKGPRALHYSQRIQTSPQRYQSEEQSESGKEKCPTAIIHFA